MLVRHGLRAVAELHAGLNETEREFVVLVAIKLEGLVEAADFAKNIARQGEVAAIHVSEAELVLRLPQPIQVRLHAATPIVNDGR